MFDTLTIAHAGPVATLWMARPEVFDALGAQPDAAVGAFLDKRCPAWMSA